MAQDNFATFAETLFHDSHEFGIASVRFGEITNRLNRGSVTLLLVLFLSLSAISATPGNSDSALSTHSFRSYKNVLRESGSRTATPGPRRVQHSGRKQIQVSVFDTRLSETVVHV